MEYCKAFFFGGLLCLIGQILIDRTKLTPARILVTYVVVGVILGAVGVYGPFAEFAGAGATVPLTGFGNTLAKGVKEAISAGGYIERIFVLEGIKEAVTFEVDYEYRRLQHRPPAISTAS